MLLHKLSHKDIGFSKLIWNYMQGDKKLTRLYNFRPSKENLYKQLLQKSDSFSLENRKILYKTISKKYKYYKLNPRLNLETLLDTNTFTITTGHQLNLFTGPLYFIYKIISAIVTAREMKKNYPEYNFVPVYWMATEDHDFEEINHFILHNKRISWNQESHHTSFPVGKLSTKNIHEIFSIVEKEFGKGTQADKLKSLFSSSYLLSSNLAEATFKLVFELFNNYGLCIVDADCPILKKQFIPYIKEDLLKQTCYKEVNKSKEYLNKIGCTAQVNPRECNLFYLTAEHQRERIVKGEEEEKTYSTVNSKKKWSEKDILQEVNNYPERFSPNVLTRPLYQEVILPNIAYIGGGNELSYWLELKSFFKKSNIPFPILLPRHSALWINEKQFKKLEKLDLSILDLFLPNESFINKYVRRISNINIDFLKQKDFLKTQFKELYQIAKQTDASFLGAVKAQEVKQIKGLDNLEKRLLKAQKRVLQSKIQRAVNLKNELFPSEKLQERTINFSELYLNQGDELFKKMLEHFKAFEYKFLVLQ